jgi:hypothetical protein
MDVEDDHEAGARAETGKSSVAADQSKKRAGSPQADKAPEDSTRKRRRMVRDWSEDEEDEDASAYMLNPWKRRSKQTRQGGSTPPAKGSQEGQTPPTGPTPGLRTAEEQARPPPQDGSQGSSAQHTSQVQLVVKVTVLMSHPSSASTERPEQLGTAMATASATREAPE